MPTLTMQARSEETYDSVTEALAASFRSLQDADTFDTASQAYLRGDLDINATLDEMETFFQGAMIDGRVERDRVVELTKRVETMCAAASIFTSIIACTLAFSCETC